MFDVDRRTVATAYEVRCCVTEPYAGPVRLCRPFTCDWPAGWSGGVQSILRRASALPDGCNADLSVSIRLNSVLLFMRPTGTTPALGFGQRSVNAHGICPNITRDTRSLRWPGYACRRYYSEWGLMQCSHRLYHMFWQRPGFIAP
jgi:hypothetical protein